MAPRNASGTCLWPPDLNSQYTPVYKVDFKCMYCYMVCK